jgi:hypothetical protein
MRCGLCALALLCAGAAVAADPPTFVGTWSTTYGTMTLTEQNGTLSGSYGGKNGISGTQRDGRFAFNYFEPGVTGEGEFTLSADGQSFAGKWRPAGSANWSNWTGKRAAAVNVPRASGPAAPPGEEPDPPKPVVYRFGHLPPGLPAYFTDGDTDKDGQVGLYEWVQKFGSSDESLAAYKALDLNRDGLLTAEEYLRAKKNAPPEVTGKGGSPPWAAPPGEVSRSASPGKVLDSKRTTDAKK